MNGSKWALLALIAAGLLVYGYKVRKDQLTQTSQQIDRGPISVAAVRGASDSLPAITPTSNAFVDYTKSLQDDESLARRNVKKYQAGVKPIFGVR